jgi:hypothetical protein
LVATGRERHLHDGIKQNYAAGEWKVAIDPARSECSIVLLTVRAHMAWTLDKVKLPRYFLLTAISRATNISHVVEG